MRGDLPGAHGVEEGADCGPRRRLASRVVEQLDHRQAEPVIREQRGEVRGGLPRPG